MDEYTDRQLSKWALKEAYRPIHAEGKCGIALGSYVSDCPFCQREGREA